MNSDSKAVEYVAPKMKKDLTKIKNPKKLRRAEKDRSDTGYYAVGNNIIIDPKLKQEMLEFSTDADGRIHYRGRWMVRGHWRHQPIGIKKLERKLIWIQPFFKGDNVSVIINKEYKVK